MPLSKPASWRSSPARPATPRCVEERARGRRRTDLHLRHLRPRLPGPRRDPRTPRRRGPPPRLTRPLSDREVALFDESLLDDPDALARADAAGCCAAPPTPEPGCAPPLRLAAEAGVGDLHPDGRPRAVLVAGPGPDADRGRRPARRPRRAAAPSARCSPAGPHRRSDLRWTLPGWAGPLDLLLLATPTAPSPGLDRPRRAGLPPRLHRRRRRPGRHPLAEAVAQVHGLALPFATAPNGATARRPAAADPGAFWALLTPLLALARPHSACSRADRTPCRRVADRLDQRRRPLRPGHRHLPQPRQDPRRRTGRRRAADVERRARSPAPSPAASRRARRPRRPPRARRRTARRAPRPRRPADQRARPGGADLDDFFRDRVEDPGACAPASSCSRNAGADRPRPPAAHRRPRTSQSATAPPITLLDAPARTAASKPWPNSSPLTEFAAVYLPSPGRTPRPPSTPRSRAAPSRGRPDRHGPPRQHHPPLRLGLDHRHPGAPRHRAHRRTPGRDVDGRPPRRPLPHRPRRGPRRTRRRHRRRPARRTRRATVKRFGPRLPFLLKMLAAATPLSLQVHPDLEQARAGYADEEARGIPADAPHRNYGTPTTSPN